MTGVSDFAGTCLSVSGNEVQYSPAFPIWSDTCPGE